MRFGRPKISVMELIGLLFSELSGRRLCGMVSKPKYTLLHTFVGIEDETDPDREYADHHGLLQMCV
jgi:hypothetical protein